MRDRRNWGENVSSEERGDFFNGGRGRGGVSLSWGKYLTLRVKKKKRGGRSGLDYASGIEEGAWRGRENDLEKKNVRRRDHQEEKENDAKRAAIQERSSPFLSGKKTDRKRGKGT